MNLDHLKDRIDKHNVSPPPAAWDTVDQHFFDKKTRLNTRMRIIYLLLLVPLLCCSVILVGKCNASLTNDKSVKEKTNKAFDKMSETSTNTKKEVSNDLGKANNRDKETINGGSKNRVSIQEKEDKDWIKDTVVDQEEDKKYKHSVKEKNEIKTLDSKQSNSKSKSISTSVNPLFAQNITPEPKQERVLKERAIEDSEYTKITQIAMLQPSQIKGDFNEVSSQNEYKRDVKLDYRFVKIQKEVEVDLKQRALSFVKNKVKERIPKVNIRDIERVDIIYKSE